MRNVPSNPFQPPFAFGTYRGDWAHSVPATSRFCDKRWVWVGFASERFFAAVAVVDVGYAGNVFAWLFDRESRTLRFDRNVTIPNRWIDVARHPQRSQLASASFLPGHASVRRDGDIFYADVGHPDLRFSLRLDGSSIDAVSAICPVPDRPEGFNATRKQAGMVATLEFDDGEFTTEEGVGFVDYSSGRLARHTEWVWAIGGDASVGFNVVSRFNDGLENVVWLDGDARPLEADVDPLTWRVTGPEIDLELRQEGVRAQKIALVIAASDYVQPLGMWHGTIHGREVAIPGVAEHHKTTW